MDLRRPFEINKYFGSANFVILFILLTSTIILLQRWIADSARMSELKILTMHLELNELKKQITPHFLFNMLNNKGTTQKTIL
jgi:LytS/YehU family sensor histidine kinase